jgi:hypothetical protein
MAQILPSYPDQPWHQSPTKSYSRVKVEKLSGACGAEISGVDLAKAVKEPDTMKEIKQVGTSECGSFCLGVLILCVP